MRLGGQVHASQHTLSNFNKYGWFFDSFRQKKNQEVIKSIKILNSDIYKFGAKTSTKMVEKN